MTNTQLQYINENLINIEIYQRDKNALFCWKCKKENTNNVSICTCEEIIDNTVKSITSILFHK